MKLIEEDVRVPAGDTDIRCRVIRPTGSTRERWPGVVLYSDIFQLTESTLRSARRLASHGFLVCAPEIYPRDFAGTALAFDDDGKQAGLAGAAATTTAQFDADRVAVLDHLQQRPDITGTLCAVGFCLGGHLAFRSAFDERVAATVCFYPTGLHDGALGADADAGTLADSHRIGGRLMTIFGTDDPHVPLDARTRIVAELARQQVVAEWHVFAGEHAFMRDEGPRHDPTLTDLSYAVAVEFLSRS